MAAPGNGTVPEPFSQGRSSILTKAFLLADAIFLGAIGIFGAITFDTTAEHIIVLAAVIGAIGVIWRSFLKPAGNAARHGAAVAVKTIGALDNLEALPSWMDEVDRRDRNRDERIAVVEAEVGTVLAVADEAANNVAAIRRHLGIGDDDVRSLTPVQAAARDAVRRRAARVARDRRQDDLDPTPDEPQS